MLFSRRCVYANPLEQGAAHIAPLVAADAPQALEQAVSFQFYLIQCSFLTMEIAVKTAIRGDQCALKKGDGILNGLCSDPLWIDREGI